MFFLKRKFLIAVICLAVSCLLTWKLLDTAEKTKQTVTVPRVAQKVEKGAKITPELLRDVEIGAYGVDGDILLSRDGLVGKYAAADIFPPDNLTMEKFTEYENIADNFVLKAQQEKKTAVAVSIKSISAALSGKLKKGDVVTVLAFVSDGGQGQEKGHVERYPELEFMEIAAITNSKAVDVNYDPERESEPERLKTAGESAFPVSVTFIADESQALRLVEAENVGNVHLVFRGRGAYGEALLRQAAESGQGIGAREAGRHDMEERRAVAYAEGGQEYAAAEAGGEAPPGQAAAAGRESGRQEIGWQETSRQETDGRAAGGQEYAAAEAGGEAPPGQAAAAKGAADATSADSAIGGGRPDAAIAAPGGGQPGMSGEARSSGGKLTDEDFLLE